MIDIPAIDFKDEGVRLSEEAMKRNKISNPEANPKFATTGKRIYWAFRI